jgi:hypothetical protein
LVGHWDMTVAAEEGYCIRWLTREPRLQLPTELLSYKLASLPHGNTTVDDDYSFIFKFTYFSQIMARRELLVLVPQPVLYSTSRFP